MSPLSPLRDNHTVVLECTVITAAPIDAHWHCPEPELDRERLDVRHAIHYDKNLARAVAHIEFGAAHWR